MATYLKFFCDDDELYLRAYTHGLDADIDMRDEIDRWNNGRSWNRLELVYGDKVFQRWTVNGMEYF